MFFSIADYKKRINTFFNKYGSSKPLMVIDGTGIGITMHLPILYLLDLSDLNSFEEIHAFSGGIYAYLTRWGFENKYNKYQYDEYEKNIDKKFRSFHFKDKGTVFTLANSLKCIINKQAIFNHTPLKQIAEYVFSDEFLSKKLICLPDNFIPYLSNKDNKIIPITKESDLRKSLSIKDLLISSACIPFIYGRYKINTNLSIYDAIYSTNFKKIRKNILLKENPKMVLSMWKNGSYKNTYYFNPIPSQKPAYRFYKDMFLLGLNIPNSIYGKEAGFALNFNHNT